MSALNRFTKLMASIKHRKTDSVRLAPAIRVSDAMGQEVLIPRDQWLARVLPTQITAAWADAEKLFAVLSSALNDGFACNPAVVEASQHLLEIDPIPERATVVRAVVLSKNQSIADAEAILTGYIKVHGETALVLCNLAKVYDAGNKKDLIVETLERALHLDPNEENTLQWLALIAKERSGEDAYWSTITNASNLPGSWLASLWLARKALRSGDMGAAVSIYKRVLGTAGNREYALRMLSGDLGSTGHLDQLIDLILPVYAPELHGPLVGINLMRALVETGRNAVARTVLSRMLQQDWPPFRQTLLDFQAALI